MVKLGKIISEIIISEYGKEEFLKRLSDPFFFQSFSLVLGWDWHSSGVTTTLTAALKEAHLEEFGISILGGKGRTSRRTPQEIENLGELFSLSTNTIQKLKYASKMSAKVDNSCVQAGYQLYHHSLIVSEDGKWCVIQQGMSDVSKYARRYHWLSNAVKSFVVEPHVAVCCDVRSKTLNMVAIENEDVRKCSVDLVKDNPNNLKKFITAKPNSLLKYLHMPKEHLIDLRNYKTLVDLHEFHPRNYEELVAFKGVGPKTVRSLALISKLIYGKKISFRDPTTFSFTVGGKDGTPYFIDASHYDEVITILTDAIKQAKLENKEKLNALSRLNNFIK
jgi:hypothetical protein